MEECENYWPVSSYHNTLSHVNIFAASEQLDVISGERHMHLPCFRLLKDFTETRSIFLMSTCFDTVFVERPEW